jgi:hypothetical protein
MQKLLFLIIPSHAPSGSRAWQGIGNNTYVCMMYVRQVHPIPKIGQQLINQKIWCDQQSNMSAVRLYDTDELGQLYQAAS